MGKNITAQKRGRGSPTFRAHGFRFVGRSRRGADGLYRVVDLVHSRAHSAPLAQLENAAGEGLYVVCPEGVRVGDLLHSDPSAKPVLGNTLPLAQIPEGTPVFNIEAAPGDGGKFVRSSGGAARIVTKMPTGVVIQFPSRKSRTFNPQCRATIGTVSGGGRPEKPFLKAGRHYHKMRQKNRYYPKVQGTSMNAVAHPFGNKRTARKSKARPAPKNAPPGRNVGMIHPRRTGRKRGTQ